MKTLSWWRSIWKALLPAATITTGSPYSSTVRWSRAVATCTISTGLASMVSFACAFVMAGRPQAHRITTRRNWLIGLLLWLSGTRCRAPLLVLRGPLGLRGWVIVQKDLSVLVLKQKYQLLSALMGLAHEDAVIRTSVNVALADRRQSDAQAFAARALGRLIHQLLREAVEENGACARAVAHRSVQSLAPTHPVLLLALRPDP